MDRQGMVRRSQSRRNVLEWLCRLNRYARARMNALVHCCGHGPLEDGNNRAERALRAVVPGRENYLLAGSDAGGGRADLYSLSG